MRKKVSLQSEYPEIANEWHPTKNGDLKPTDVTLGSEKMVWWICEKGHEWEASVSNRRKAGCPICSGRKVLAGYNDLVTTNPELAAQWNLTKNRDLTPSDVTAGSGQVVWWRCEKGHEWQTSVVNRKRTGCPFCSGKKVFQGFNDLATTNPEIAAQWHPTNNGDLKPTDVSIGSSKIIWWKCEKGHEWQTPVYSRKETGCPYCSGKKVLQGLNDLATTNPKIAAEWHPTKNGGLMPTDVTDGSSKMVWWLCSRGHEWQAHIYTRKKAGCPYCANKSILIGFNDLATTNPELAVQWHPTKNGNLKPTDVTIGSNVRAWWKCEKGHEWEATVHGRKKAGCPYCSGKRVLQGWNDLVTVNPALAAEWHPTQNGDLKPNEVTAGNDRIVWWKCEKGHEWQAGIGTRNRRKNGCPYCANRLVLEGYNDLATTNPELAAQWHPTKNGALKPIDVAIGSGKRVWWRCEKGHEWITSVASRKKTGCPYCAGQKAILGINDLATTNPELISEWHPTRNGKIGPEDVTPGSAKRVWWICEKGHEWQVAINTRARQGTKCPYCSGRRAISGENDLETNNPFLASEWDSERNGIPASEVSIRSGIKYWWKCSVCGYEWKASPHNRTNGSVATGCPKCALESQTSYPEQVLFYYLKKYYPDAINKYRDIFSRTMELDIFVPSVKTGVEYDGMAWHKGELSEKNDNRKYTLCKEHGIRLIRIKETLNDERKYACDIQISVGNHPSNEELKDALLQLSQYIPMEDEFNIPMEEANIRKQYVSDKKESSLAKQRPDLADQWNYEKNNGLLPTMFSVGSNKKVWWKCEKGHEWQAVISSRKKNGCPYCGRETAGKARRKAIINVDTGEIFEYAKDAADKFGCRAAGISACCRGDQKIYKGYHWKYFDD